MIAHERSVYWHRDLPPAAGEPVDEHIVEATSMRVKSNLANRDALWDPCYEDLMRHAQDRLQQEVTRLDGDYARVIDESIDSRRDDVSGEAWLHGRFSY